jgi:hypothetical protein
MKFTQRKKYTPRSDRPNEQRAKELELMEQDQGPITKCQPESAQGRALSASANVAKGPSKPR